MNCKIINFKTLLPLMSGDKFWENYLREQLSSKNHNASLHLAIFVEPYLQYILEGMKTIESRFSVKRSVPYNAIDKGDIIVMKKSGGPVLGICYVSEAWFYKLNRHSWHTLKKEYKKALCAHEPEFWNSRKNAAFATLIKIDKVKSISPLMCNKKDRRGWVILQKGKIKGGLF